MIQKMTVLAVLYHIYTIALQGFQDHQNQLEIHNHELRLI